MRLDDDAIERRRQPPKTPKKLRNFNSFLSPSLSAARTRSMQQLKKARAIWRLDTDNFSPQPGRFALDIRHPFKSTYHIGIQRIKEVSTWNSINYRQAIALAKRNNNYALDENLKIA